MAYARVQGANVQAAVGATIPVTLGAAVTAGNFVWGIITYDGGNGAVLSTVTDDKGNTYNISAKLNDTVDSQASQIYWRGNITGGPTTITANFTTANPSFPGMTATEFSGVLAATDPKDVAPGSSFNNPSVAGSNGITSGNITTLTNGCMILGAVDVGSGAGNPTAGTGFALTDVNTTINMATEFLTQGSAGLVQATFSLASATQVTCWVLAVQPAVAAVSLVAPLLFPAFSRFPGKGPFAVRPAVIPGSLSASNDNAAASITLDLLTSSAAIANPVTASASITLGALTASATATVADAATSSVTLAALTASATVADPDAASAAVTLGALTASAAATATDAATAAFTLAALTSSATATVTSSAAAAITLGALTSAAVVTDPEAATAANTLAPLSVAATAAVTDQAAAAITLGALTVAATVSDTPGLFAAITLGSLTTSATATVVDAASASVTLGALTTVATAAVKDAAAANITLGNLTAAAAAVAKDAVSAPITLAQLTASSIVINPAAAQAAISLGAMTAVAIATHPGTVLRRVDPAALMI